MPTSSSITFHPKANYIEITFFSKVIEPSKLYDISLCERVFKEIHAAVTTTVCKRSFEKKIKRYMKWDREYLHHFDQDKFSVVKKTLLAYTFHDTEHYIVQQFDRSALMVHQFPWDNQLHGMEYVSRCSFKLTNRLFLNLEVRDTVIAAGDGETTRSYHAFINYNHADNVETGTIGQHLEALLSAILPVIQKTQAPIV